MSTLFVATTGGHLAQLCSFSERVARDGAAVWVTHENEQSTSMLAGHDVEFVPYVGARDVGGVLRRIPHARRLLRTHRFTRAISTGSGIALGYLPYLAARGVACHYIESAARVSGPSLTGRLLRHVRGVRVYTQYRSWTGGRWRYRGNWFDEYEPISDSRELGETARIVVTLGTATEFPFRRAVVGLSSVLAANGPLAQHTGRPLEVLWQTGGTPVGDLPIIAHRFLPEAELRAAASEADIVVCHAGTGSVRTALDAGCRPVVVPRRDRKSVV